MLRIHISITINNSYFFALTNRSILKQHYAAFCLQKYRALKVEVHVKKLKSRSSNLPIILFSTKCGIANIVLANTVAIKFLCIRLALLLPPPLEDAE